MSIGRAAMLLAMTENREEEAKTKDWLASIGYEKSIATEVSGPLTDFKQKVMKNAVTAALHSGIIRDEANQIHAVCHAVLEAVQGVLVINLGNPSMKIKTAIVSDGLWIAVGMFGLSALHIHTNHERAGLGIMHLSLSV